MRLGWQGREVTVGGAYHLETNMVNQLSVVQARLSALGLIVRGGVVGTDRYRGSINIFAGEQKIQTIPIDLPGPLSVSSRAGGAFDIVAPLRSFREPRPSPVAHLIHLERGTCNPTGILDLSDFIEQIPNTLPQHGLPFPLPFQKPEHP